MASARADANKEIQRGRRTWFLRLSSTRHAARRWWCSPRPTLLRMRMSQRHPTNRQRQQSEQNPTRRKKNTNDSWTQVKHETGSAELAALCDTSEFYQPQAANCNTVHDSTCLLADRIENYETERTRVWTQVKYGTGRTKLAAQRPWMETLWMRCLTEAPELIAQVALRLRSVTLGSRRSWPKVKLGCQDG